MKKDVAKVERVMTKIPVNEVERLEAFYTCYTLRPTKIDFDLFGEYFEYMKSESLLKELSQEEKELLKLVYGNNGKKLKCAWVQKTFDYFMMTGFRFNTNKLKAV
jgi:hypothetical protein